MIRNIFCFQRPRAFRRRNCSIVEDEGGGGRSRREGGPPSSGSLPPLQQLLLRRQDRHLPQAAAGPHPRLRCQPPGRHEEQRGGGQGCRGRHTRPLSTLQQHWHRTLQAEFSPKVNRNLNLSVYYVYVRLQDIMLFKK